ncbi:MAG: hypothetical protein A3H96_00550 [Acidobacteria bacterium RIFCSPLOWO2_02_FULL_67_36]|nr:MAG: hypothetical protein A3H96_00550 [Acidobacteria bacterium RIFCSPLOWO2_02_FULL_67_36]
MTANDSTYPWSGAAKEYFIRPDGTFVGDFEGMYRNCEDPWGQSVEVSRSPLNRIITSRIAQLPERRVLDLGCGNGDSSELFRTEGNAEVLGVEISPTAVANAKARYPLCKFEVASATEVARFADMRPTAICMSGLTWCILDGFRELLASIEKRFPGALLFHTLTFYGPGMQKYGTEYFTSLDELLPYFSPMTIEETFVHRVYPTDGSCNTLVVARV